MGQIWKWNAAEGTLGDKSAGSFSNTSALLVGSSLAWGIGVESIMLIISLKLTFLEATFQTFVLTIDEASTSAFLAENWSTFFSNE